MLPHADAKKKKKERRIEKKKKNNKVKSCSITRLFFVVVVVCARVSAIDAKSDWKKKKLNVGTFTTLYPLYSPPSGTRFPTHFFSPFFHQILE